MRVLLKDGSVLEQGKWKQTDVAIENGVIVARGEQLSFPAEKVFDCRGFALFPGFVDVHVHLREPGFSYKETIATGSAACAWRIYDRLRDAEFESCAGQLGASGSGGNADSRRSGH